MLKINLVVFLLAAISHSVELVAELESLPDSGEEKFKIAVQETKEFLDNEADFLPLWGTLTEEQRDRILTGIVEFALVLYRKTHVETVKVRKQFVKLTKVSSIKKGLAEFISRIQKQEV